MNKLTILVLVFQLIIVWQWKEMFTIIWFIPPILPVLVLAELIIIATPHKPRLRINR